MLYSGSIIYSFALPKNAFPDGEYAVSLLVDEADYYSDLSAYEQHFNVSNGEFTFSWLSGTYTEIGDMIYVQVVADYKTAGYSEPAKILQFTLKTHSTVSTDVGSVILKGITIVDSVNGAYSVDFTKCMLRCEKFNYFKSQRTKLDSCKVELNGKTVSTAKNSFKVSYEASQLNTVRDRQVINFGLPGGTASGQSGDATLTVTSEYPYKTLSKGYMYMTLCLYEEDLEDGTYTLYIGKGSTDSTSLITAGIQELKLQVKNGRVTTDSGSAVVNHVDGRYFVHVKTNYDGSESFDDSRLIVSLKSADSSSGQLKNIDLNTIAFADTVNGIYELPLEDCEIAFTQQDAEGETVSLQYTLKQEGCGLYIKDAPTEVVIGETVRINAASDNYETLDLTWSSSDSSIASVDSNGGIMGVSTGKAVITVTDSSKDLSCSFEINVRAPYFELVSDKTTLLVGQEYYIAVLAHGFTAGKLTYKSSNTKVGTIDSKTGLFTAIAAGTTTVTVTDSAKHKLTVKMTVKKNTVDATDYVTMIANSAVSKGVRQEHYDYICNMYSKVMGRFGAEGFYPYIEISYDYLAAMGAGAYVTADTRYNDGQHFLMVIGIEAISASNINATLTHELTHAFQAYSSYDADGGDALWVTEGLATYSAYILAINHAEAISELREYSKSQNYDDSYGVTATFIDFVAKKYYPAIGQCLNEAMREQSYTADFWAEFTGLTAEELWQVYGKWAKRNQLL